MFLVSERQGKNFVTILLCVASIFCLATFWLRCANQVMYGRFARAKSAWNETNQYQSAVSMASCVPALFYNNMLSFACTVTIDHLRFHFVATEPGEVLFVVFLHMCILRSAARFYCRHVTWHQPAKGRIAKTQPTRWPKLLALRRSTLHGLWFWACVLIAAPGVVYSTVKAASQAEALQHMKAFARPAINANFSQSFGCC
eukprot:663702-Amphidinium_carterae.1